MSFEEPLYDDAHEDLPPFRTFVFHGGRNPLWKDVADFIWKKLEIETVALREPETGNVLDIDTLDQVSEDACHAVLVFTADDDRERILHALGYFRGLYGPNNVVVLKESNVAEFPGVAGVLYETFEGRDIASTFGALTEEIEGAKAEYDDPEEDED